MCSNHQASMSSSVLTLWSATEPMPLLLSAQAADDSAPIMKSIPSAAQRYYAQPRMGNSSSSATPFADQDLPRTGRRDDLMEARPSLEAKVSRKVHNKGVGKAKEKSKARRGSKLSSSQPTRQSPRLIPKRITSLQRMLRERLAGELSPKVTKSRRPPRKYCLRTFSDALPALSEDPARYNSHTDDCRFHLPSTNEDRFAVRAALTPTIFRLKKKGWHGSVVWNPDASYMEAHQKCLQEYYNFELMKADLSPLDLPAVLTLLPWYGKISDFRNSPNWPKGW
jgi:hypothetical protein